MLHDAPIAAESWSRGVLCLALVLNAPGLADPDEVGVLCSFSAPRHPATASRPHPLPSKIADATAAGPPLSPP